MAAVLYCQTNRCTTPAEDAEWKAKMAKKRFEIKVTAKE
jgi:hypothetical protein